MDKDGATLEVGFEIQVGDAFGNLRSLDNLIGTSAANAVRQFTRMEAASKGMIDVSGSTVALKTFGSAATRELETARQAIAKVEGAGEKMATSLERSIPFIGKSASEARQLRAETAALAAEGRGLTELAGRIRTMSAAYAEAERAADGATRGTGRNNFALKQTAIQIPDIVTGLLTGQKPMQVFLQQGGQIAQIAQMADGGIKGYAASIGTLALRFAPLLIATGTAVAAFELLKNQVSDDKALKAYADSLGLTHKEMKKLGDVGITTGDVLAGLATTIGERTGLDKVFDGFGEKAQSAAHMAFTVMVDAAAGYYAAWVGSYNGILATWRQFPAALADLVIQAANGALSGIQWLINKTVDAVNSVGGNLSHVDLGQLKNNYAGAAKTAATAVVGEWKKSFDQAKGAIQSVVTDVAANTLAHAEARYKKKADEIIADRTPKKPKVDHHAEELAREAAATEAQIKNLYALADAYGVSGAAALIAEAREKAESAAIKGRADIEAVVERQIRLAIAQRVADAAKATAAMRDQAGVQEEVNAQVEAGLVPMAKAAELVQQRIASLPILAALVAAGQVGDAKAAAEALAQLNAQREAQDRLNASKLKAQDLAQADQIKKSIALTQQEGDVAVEAGQKRLASLRGLSGQPLEDALADINTQQEKSVILLRAQAEAADDVAKGYTNAAAAALVKGQADAAAVQQQADQRKSENDITRRKQQFLDVAQQFVDIVGGGLGRAVNAILPLLDKAKAAFSGGNALGAIGASAGLGSAASSIAGKGTGSQIGGAIVGAMGGALGNLVGGPLGGMIGSVAGGILGGIVGGLFKHVKKASATIEVIAGDAVTSSITGNSSKLKTVAGSMADSLISGLSGIADQLGGALSDSLHVSIGQRNKTYRVDLSGQGRTKGMPSFKTEDEAVAYAVQSVIQQGAITGLSAAEQTLLKGKGDLQTQLQKVMSFKGVFDELKQKTDPVGYAMDQIATKFAGLQKVFQEAGASADDYAKLQQLRGIEEKEAQAQAQQAVQDDSERLGLERQLAEAVGDTAKMRQMDLDALLPANRELQQRIWAIQDEADAAAKAAAAADAAAQAEQALASTRENLEGQILQLTGDTAAIRARELAALDPSLRALQERIYALQDEQAATQAATQAAQAAAQAAAAIAQERAGLETTLLQLQGNTNEQRARELAALDPSNRALQQQIYTLQDLQAATEAATQAQADAAQKAAAFAQERAGLEDQIFELEGNTAEQRYRALQALDPNNRVLQQYIWNLQDAKTATEAASQATADAAAKEQQVAEERAGLQQQLWEATGNTAAIRAAQLASLDPSNRALQEQIYALSDAKDAADAAKQLADAWTSIGDSIMDEVKRIRGLTDAGGGNTFASLQGQFNAAITAARAGDQDAAKGLPDLSKSLLDAAALAATSRQELARVEAQTAASLEGVYGMIAGATTASAAATAALTGSGSSSSSTSDAAAWWSTFAAGSGDSAADDRSEAKLEAIRREIAQLRADNNDGNATISGRIGDGNKILDRVTDGGDAMQVAADKPLPTKAAA
ncbi:hypothetical protein [Sphingomonas sp.]|uniref:hypothetical protein n=1 Tax=Sphingomonas sp. TaxID=28214 RepID=UPI003B00F28E